MTASTEVAVRSAANLVPARPILAYAEALGGPRLAADAKELLAACEAVGTAFERLRLLDEAVEMERRSQEASEALLLSQAAGGALEDDAERLHGEAEDAWKRAATGWAASWFVPEEITTATREYAARPHFVSTPTRFSGDWRESAGLMDWSRGGRGAA